LGAQNRNYPKVKISNVYIQKIYSGTKRRLLNKIIAEHLPTKYKYIFWVDADVIFQNPNWIVEGVEELQSA
jgi:3-polyprenyl-4-hydroxybenzoate decarboxylase